MVGRLAARKVYCNIYCNDPLTKEEEDAEQIYRKIPNVRSRSHAIMLCNHVNFIDMSLSRGVCLNFHK
jgi:hypothetical protein